MLTNKKEKFDLEQSILTTIMRKTQVKQSNNDYQESLAKVRARIQLEEKTISIQKCF